MDRGERRSCSSPTRSRAGFCRTGDWFACDHEGVVPDLVTTAKGIAGGLPLAAVTGRAEIMDAVHVGGLGGTYGGNPVACAAALGAIEAMETPRPVRRARRLGDDHDRPARGPRPRSTRASATCADAGRWWPSSSSAPDGRTRSPARTGAVSAYCHREGVVTLTCGTYGNVLRFLPPLSIPEALLEEALDVLAEAFEATA